MAILRSNNFEAGVAAGTAIDGTNSAVGGNAFTYFNGAPVYSATRSHGSLGLDCTANAVAAAVGWTGLATKTFQFREYIKLSAAPSATGQIFTARNSSNYVAGLNLTTARKIAVTHWGGAALYTSTTVIPTDLTSYRVELWGVVNATGTGELHFALYLGDSTTPLETFDTTTADLQATNVIEVRSGKHAASGTISLFIDDMAVGDQAAFLGPAANIPPTVSAGANQTVAPGATVSVTASASDSDGSVVSTTWAYVYPATGGPTLTGASTATASFTAGAAGNLYILQVTATDDAGATATSNVEIRVPATGTLTPLPQNATGTGSWTRAGAAATDGAALADALDTTYLESPSVSGAEVNRRLRLAPSAPRTSATVTVRVQQDVAGSLTATARLYEGSTLRQSWTVPVTTGWVDNVLTLSGGTVAAIVDWGNLYIELAATS